MNPDDRAKGAVILKEAAHIIRAKGKCKAAFSRGGRVNAIGAICIAAGYDGRTEDFLFDNGYMSAISLLNEELFGETNLFDTDIWGWSDTLDKNGVADIMQNVSQKNTPIYIHTGTYGGKPIKDTMFFPNR